jgi:hypothetical protein
LGGKWRDDGHLATLRGTLSAILKHVFMLNIRSKQELLEPHCFTAPAPPGDVAQYGSSSCIITVKLIFHFFFTLKGDFDPDHKI